MINYWKLLSIFFPDKLTPAFDLLRLALRYPNVNQHLYNPITPEEKGNDFGVQIIQRAKESKDVATQCMVCRVLCNSFKHQDGSAFLLIEQTRQTITEVVLDFEDIKMGSLPKNASQSNLRIAVATLLLNYAVGLHKEGLEKGNFVNPTADMLEKTNDAETNYRLLVALGTLLTDDEYALGIATSRDVVKHVRRLKEHPGQAKVGRCAHFVEKMLTGT